MTKENITTHIIKKITEAFASKKEAVIEKICCAMYLPYVI